MPRLHLNRSALRFAPRALAALLGLAMIWYGLMTLLLAVKVSPGFVNDISAYRDVYDWFAGLTADDVDGLFRGITAAAGAVAFLLFGYLAWKAIPRPALATAGPRVGGYEGGRLRVRPRAAERVAELAALGERDVADASGRYVDDEMRVAVRLARATGAVATLRRVREQVARRLEEHGIPAADVSVLLTGLDEKTRRVR